MNAKPPRHHIPWNIMGQSGMTLMEVMIVIAVLGILMSGLTETMGLITRSISFARNNSLASQSAQSAVIRMARFVMETDFIIFPASDGLEVEQLTIGERILDLVDNTTRIAGSDTKADTDTDADGLINEGGGDGKESVVFKLDKTEANNWKLTETVPDYATADLNDTMPAQVICDHVTAFKTQWLSQGVVLVYLRVQVGDMDTSVETRVKARLLTPKAIFP